MRIAIFAETFLPKLDGIANTLCHLLDYLQEQGHRALLFCPRGAPDTYAGTRVIGLPAMAFPFYRDLRLVPPVVSVSNELRAFDPDLIHLVNPASLGLVGMGEAARRGVPVVASYHTDLPGYTHQYGMPFMEGPMWSYLRFVHNSADLNLAPSQFTRQQLLAHGFKRVRIWGRGVDTERFDPAQRSLAWRERLSEGQCERPLLLYVGRLATEKRVDWLRPVLDANPEARLAIVGDGPEREHLERVFAGTDTVFTGFLTGHDLASAYASSDLFVFPSPTETLGNVVLEAMASGLTVVAPNSGGPLDHVRDGENGYLFDSTNKVDLINIVTSLVAGQGYTRWLGARARQYACTQTWDKVFGRLMADYRWSLAYRRRVARQRRLRGGWSQITMLVQNARNDLRKQHEQVTSHPGYE